MKSPESHPLRGVLFFVGTCLAALASLGAAEAPRTAVLDFVRTDSPGSQDGPATDFSRAVQARLLANNHYTWVERQEFDRITRETDLAGLNRSDAASAVRLGQLLRADLLVRGQIEPQAVGQGKLTLEVIDLKRAEVLATRALPVGMSANQRLRPTASDVAAASEAAGKALAEARDRFEQLRTLRVIAPLYVTNVSRTERADFVEARVNDALSAATTPATGFRVLRFPRTDEAGEESSLVLAGLTDTNPDAWQQVADAYVWGTVNEQGADGVEFSEVSVTISLQVLGGTGEPREVRWEGPVKSLDTGLQTVAAGVLEATKAASQPAVSATGRKQIAEALHKRADEVWQAIMRERKQPRAGATTDFLRTTPGRQSFAYRLKLLEAACFFDPLNRSLQDARLEAAWESNPAEPLATLQGHWRRMADYDAQARRFERKPDGSPDPVWIKRRTTQLMDLVKALERSPWDARSRGRASPEDIQRQRRAAIARWSAAVVAANQLSGTVKVGIATDEDNWAWIEDLYYLSDNSGDLVIARQVVDQTWPALKKAVGRLLKSSDNEQRKQNFINQIYSIYDSFGAFDQAAAMLDEAWKVGSARLPVTGATPPPSRRTDRLWQAPKSSLYMSAMSPAPELPKLEALIREVEFRPATASYQLDTRNGGGLEKRSDRIIDALAWQDGRLWIAESGTSLPPEDGTPNPQGNAYVWRYDPALHVAEQVTAKLGAHSQVRDLLPVGEELWLALDADGVWRDDKTASVHRYKTEDGLMSPRMAAAQAAGAELLFLGGTAPNYSISRYAMATSKWSGVQVESAPNASTQPSIPGSAGSGGRAPQMAVSSDWLAVSTPAVSFYNLSTNAWSNLLAQVPSLKLSAQGGMPPGTTMSFASQQFTLVSADERGFWLGFFGGLLFLDPRAPAETKYIPLTGMPTAAAHHGPWLWLTMNDAVGRPQLVLIDKRTLAITSMLPLPAGFTRKIVATDTRLWLGGSRLLEVLLREPRLEEAAVAEVARSDHQLLRAVWYGDAARVNALLLTKPKVDEATASGWTPLMVAAEAGQSELAERLLEAGANPNLLARNGRTALQLALEADNLPLAELLLKHNADAGLTVPVRLCGLMALQPRVDDLTLPPENKAIPNPPTGLKATVNTEGEVVLTWQEHGTPDTRYQVTRDSAVIADLPAGVARFVDANTPWGEARVRYGISARNVWGHWAACENEVPEVTLAPPPRPADVVVLPLGFNTGGMPAPLPQWAGAQPSVVEAASAGRSAAIKLLLAHGADVNRTDGTGQTALIAATRAGKYDVARQLLAAGAKAGVLTHMAESAASVAYRRHDHEAFFREIMAALSPEERKQEASGLIIEAAGSGQIKDIELLLSLGGDLSGLTAFGESALSMAVQRDQVETALWLLEQKPPLHHKVRAPLGTRDADQPVLEAAMRTNRPEIVARLLATGFDGNAEINGKPLVIVAAQRKSFETLRLLQEHGADLKRKDNEGKTLANYLSPEEVRLFLPDGAAVASWPPPRGKGAKPIVWTLPATEANPARRVQTEQLVAACKVGDLAVAKEALQAGAEIDQLSEDGRNALHHALIAQQSTIVRWLVEEGASVNIVSRGGNSPLNFAIQNGEQLAMIDFLLAAGADPNAFGLEGYAAVYSAVATSNRPALKRLIQTEADVNLLGHDNNRVLVSPLAIALAKADEESVALLLAAGANSRSQTFSFVQIERATRKDAGPTLLMYAASGGKVGLVKQMITLGQDPRFKTYEDYDALSWAAGAGNKEVVEFLLPTSEKEGRALQNARRKNQMEIATILERAGYQSR